MPENSLIARATAHGGVPSARGHGSWARPKAEAPVSWRCRSRTEPAKACGFWVAAYAGSRRMRAATSELGPQERWSGWERPRMASRFIEVTRDGELLDQGVRLVGGDGGATGGDGFRDDAALVAHQGDATAQQDERRLAVLAEVAGQAAPEGDHRVLAQAVRRGEEPGLAELADHVVGEDPLRHDEGGARQGQGLGAGAAVRRDRVDRRLDRAGAAQRGERLDGLVAVPRGGVVPVDQAGVGAGGDPRQRRVRAVAVEVVETQDREPEPFGEV